MVSPLKPAVWKIIVAFEKKIRYHKHCMNKEEKGIAIHCTLF